MYTFAVLPLLAGLSAAWVFPTLPESVASRLGQPLRRAQGDWQAPKGSDPAADGYFTVYACPSGTPAVVNSILKTDQLGQAQADLITACSTTDKVIPANAGGPGLQKSSGDVAVQLCNMDEGDKSLDCNPGYISHMLDQIWCGDQKAPTPGYGQVKKKGDTQGQSYYVYYGPKGNMTNCKTSTEFYQMGVKPGQKCDNAALQSSCGDQPQTSDATIQ